MKKLVLILAFILLFVAEAFAQGGPNMFKTEVECRSAYLAGRFSYYTPKFFSHYKDNPVNGKDKVAVPIIADCGFKMRTVDGIRYVVLQAGTIIRCNVGLDGRMTPYAHDKCGNRIYSEFSLKNEQLTEFETGPLLPIPPEDQEESLVFKKPYMRDMRERPEQPKFEKADNTLLYVGLGVLAAAVVYLVATRNNEEPGLPPSVRTGGVGPGVETGPAGPGVSSFIPKPRFKIGFGVSF